MTFRYLFGPTSSAVATGMLACERAAGRCVTFGAEGTDLPITAGISKEELQGRLPSGWQPDVLILAMNGQPIPPALWSAPWPRIGLLSHGRACWHWLRLRLQQCAMVFAPPAEAQFGCQLGWDHLRSGVVPLTSRSVEVASESNRDLDVFLAGELQPALHPEELPQVAHWLRKLDHRRVHWPRHPASDSARALLCRSRAALFWGTSEQESALLGVAVAAGALVLLPHDDPWTRWLRPLVAVSGRPLSS